MVLRGVRRARGNCGRDGGGGPLGASRGGGRSVPGAGRGHDRDRGGAHGRRRAANSFATDRPIASEAARIAGLLTLVAIVGFALEERDRSGGVDAPRRVGGSVQAVERRNRTPVRTPRRTRAWRRRVRTSDADGRCASGHPSSATDRPAHRVPGSRSTAPGTSTISNSHRARDGQDLDVEGEPVDRGRTEDLVRGVTPERLEATLRVRIGSRITGRAIALKQRAMNARCRLPPMVRDPGMVREPTATSAWSRAATREWRSPRSEARSASM